MYISCKCFISDENWQELEFKNNHLYMQCFFLHCVSFIKAYLYIYMHYIQEIYHLSSLFIISFLFLSLCALCFFLNKNGPSYSTIKFKKIKKLNKKRLVFFSYGTVSYSLKGISIEASFLLHIFNMLINLFLCLVINKSLQTIHIICIKLN